MGPEKYPKSGRPESYSYFCTVLYTLGQMVTDAQYKESQKEVCTTIERYLEGFKFRDEKDETGGNKLEIIEDGKKKGEVPVNDLVQSVCDEACSILLPEIGAGHPMYQNEPYGISQGEPKIPKFYNANGKNTNFKFEKSWIERVPRILPNEDKIIEILPFLLTCYTGNVKHNKIDPGTVPKDEKYAAWDIIFDPHFKYHKESVSNVDLLRNRNARVKSLSSYFFYKSESYGSLLLIKLAPFFNNKWEFSRDEFISAGRKSIQALELCRRFAAFAYACRGYQKVNLTLSMALFSHLFQWNESEETNKASKIELSYEGDPYREKVISVVRKNKRRTSKFDIYMQIGLLKRSFNDILEMSREELKREALLEKTNFDEIWSAETEEKLEQLRRMAEKDTENNSPR